ncbi:hypothetical protein R3W88_014838 [Solanum pinnatisectum]|uniref:DUF4283 domain-containing protein n=1 Tax=Solanum pinnatisectum TaxID=50273 RepID=A0AAV9KSS7_9SOLN|nr:hypothetical protein R3W88_014838 [Solanum pinnatisectum]
MLEEEQDMGPIILSEEDKQRIYNPWKYVVIVKLFVKKISHRYLKNKLTDLWKPTEPLTLIDLGWDFHIAKFNRQENMNKALHEGPWFVIGNFLSVNYHCYQFYDKIILEKIGKKLGRLCYARICVQVPLGQPLQNEITIGTHTQKVIYEGEGILCTHYGKIGHVLNNCPTQSNLPPNNTTTSTEETRTPEEAWNIVSFSKRKKKPSHPPPPTHGAEAGKGLQIPAPAQVNITLTSPGKSPNLNSFSI